MHNKLESLTKSILALILLALLSLQACDNSNSGESGYTALDKEVMNHPHDQGFVGSNQCVECHAEEHRLWMGSDHQLAMQEPTDETVLGDFNNSSFEYDGVVSKFFKRDGKFMVNTEGPDGKYHDYVVKYTFGHYPLQQYLVDFPKGNLQVLTPFWDTRSKEDGGQKWVHLYEGDHVPAHDPLHWGRGLQNWNYMCSECHSTNLKKNFDPVTKAYNTQWDEINVSCEACHGPGDTHIKWAKEGEDPEALNYGLIFDIMDRDTAYWDINPKTGAVKRSAPRTDKKLLEYCGRCHSRRTQLTEDYRFGEDLEQTHRLAWLERPLYHDDGSINDEDYVYGSFLQSKMYQAGVVCKDCHDVHSGQLKAPGSKVCAQCHLPEFYDTPDHHKHKDGGEGASCIMCHAPKLDIMVVDPRSDHSFRIPRPDLSVKVGSSNACTMCHYHKDESDEWALEHFEDWYGKKYDTIPHYAHTFHAVRENEPLAQMDLNELIRDNSQTDLVRASAILMLDYRNNPQALENAQMALNSANAYQRRAAVESLRELPEEMQWQLASPLINDPVFDVRLRAEELLMDHSGANLSPADQALLQKGRQEYIEQLKFWQDRAFGLTQLGGAYARLGDLALAENYYQQAIEMDSLFPQAYVNYADLKRQQNQEEEAVELLQKAIAIDENFAVAHQALAFAYIRSGNRDKALSHLHKAYQAMPEEDNFAYLYILALNDMGQGRKAIDELDKAFEQNPNSEQLLNLAYSLYRNGGNPMKAKQVAGKLRELYPYNENYRNL